MRGIEVEDPWRMECLNVNFVRIMCGMVLNQLGMKTNVGDHVGIIHAINAIQYD